MLANGSGTGRAAKALQRIAGVEADGAVGAATVAAVKKMDAKVVIKKMAIMRESFYRNLNTFATFGRGWLRRNEETLEVALSMVSKKTVLSKIASALG